MDISELQLSLLQESGSGRTCEQWSGRGVPDALLSESDVGDGGIGEETVLGDENIWGVRR